MQAPNAGNIALIEKAITEVVQRYEPRLRNIAVQFCEDRDEPLKMRFTLSAELSDVQGEDNGIVFQTVLSPNGRISIRRQQTTAF